MLPEDDGLQKMMKNRLANLTLPVLNVQNKENLQETIDRKNYFFYPNKNGFKRLRSFLKISNREFWNMKMSVELIRFFWHRKTQELPVS